MKKLRNYLSVWSAAFFANETTVTDDQVTFAVANEAKYPLAPDWVMLAPYGDFDHPQGMQRFQRVDAQTIVNEFRSIRNLPSRILGLPWYIGHPDHPAFRDRYKDTRAYGRIKELEARDDGLYANVKFNEDGKRLIESEAFHGHSVNWRMAKSGNVYRPVSLKSVGFTNEPNIPVQPITQANEKEITMLKWLATLLGLAADATEDQIKTKTQERFANEEQLKTKLSTAETELAGERGKVTTLTSELANERGKVTSTEALLTVERTAHSATVTKLTTAEANFANERKARIAALVEDGIRAGKILPAEKVQWETEFANEFEATSTKLSQANAKLHTQSVTAGLGKRSSEQLGRNTRIQEFVNERMEKNREDYTTAFSWVRQNKPELFKDMKDPLAATAS